MFKSSAMLRSGFIMITITVTFKYVDDFLGSNFYFGIIMSIIPIVIEFVFNAFKSGVDGENSFRLQIA